MPTDEELCDYLSRSDVKWAALDESARGALEQKWREIYGRAFVGRPRLRQGGRADHAYDQESCTRCVIIPFTSNVDGLPIQVCGSRKKRGYECCGPLIPLGRFCTMEFFICPSDFAWTMVHTHEDHAFGGPFFIRREWIP